MRYAGADIILTPQVETKRAMHSVISAQDITLGILAGGRASRLGGIDKAWLERDGVPQVLRWSRRFAGEHGPLLVSANRDLERYAAHEIRAVCDRSRDLGPLGGLDALAAACETSWLLTLPVDVVGVNDCLLRTLVSKRSDNGAYAADDDGASAARGVVATRCVARGLRRCHRRRRCGGVPARAAVRTVGGRVFGLSLR